MLTLEFAVTMGAFTATMAGIAYVVMVVRNAGSEQVVSPARVKHLRENAPYDRLDNILAKRR